MSSQANILANALGMPPERAEGLVEAVRTVASSMADGRVTVHALMEQTHEDPEFLKSVLATLLLNGVLGARFVPYHRKCDRVIGADEPSVDMIYSKLDDGEYSIVCPNCHDYLDGPNDLIIRILFSLPSENA